VSAELDRILASGQPYFIPEDQDAGFLQANQGNIYFKHFGDIVRSIQRTPLTILEIGSWAGNSLHAWDQAAGGTAQLIAVDSWSEYIPESTIMQDALRSGEIKQLFWHNMRTSGIVNRLFVLEGKSRDILPTLAADSVDIVFIDGDHRYAYVKDDILLSMRLVRDGGVMCGDDMWKQMDDIRDKEHCLKAVLDGLQHTIDSDNVGYHPGVATAVNEVFGPVTVLDRMWAVQKRDGIWCNL
jgi:hypothetical protein